VDQGILGETGTPSSTTEDCGNESVQEMGKTVQVNPIQRQKLKSGLEKRRKQQSKSKGVTPVEPSSTLKNGNSKRHEVEIWDCETAVSAYPKSQTIKTGALKAQPQWPFSTNHNIPSNRSTPFYRTFISGTPPGSSESQSSETSAISNVKVKPRGSLKAPSKRNKSRPELTLGKLDVTSFMPEAMDVYNVECCVDSNPTRTPPESSDDEKRSYLSSLPNQEGTQLFSSNLPQKSSSANTIYIRRKNPHIESEGFEKGNYFSKKTVRYKLYKPGKRRFSRRRDIIFLTCNSKKRQQPKEPYFQRGITKHRPIETGSNTAEPVQSMVEKLKKTPISVVIVQEQLQKIMMSNKIDGPILNDPTEEPINELKRKSKRNWKSRKKKKKNWQKKRRPPKMVKG